MEDSTPPELAAPEDVTVEQTSFSGAIPDLGEATAPDLCDADVEITNTALPVFPLGQHAVAWTAIDDSGNVATADQTVTVVDTTPPDLTIPPDITAEQQDAAGATIDIGQAVATDICDPAPVVTNTALVIFPLGETLVRWTATDFSGNVRTAIQTITIVDTKPPYRLSTSLSSSRARPAHASSSDGLPPTSVTRIRPRGTRSRRTTCSPSAPRM